MKVNFLFLFAFVLTLLGLFVYLGEPFLVAMANATHTYSGKLMLERVEADDWTKKVRRFENEVPAEAVTVLMYHRVLAEEELEPWHYQDKEKIYDTIVLKEAFTEQMQFLSEQGYVTLTLKEFELFMLGELDVPEKSVLITFDDGFKDNFTEAYPILKSHNFNATIFLITNSVATGDPLYLNEADLKAGGDVFEYQSHTDALHQKNEAGDAYLTIKPATEVEADLLTSIEKLGNRHRAFAYPYGVYQADQVDLLAVLGFHLAFTVEYKQASRTEELLEIPRISVFPEDTLADFQLKFN